MNILDLSYVMVISNSINLLTTAFAGIFILKEELPNKCKIFVIIDHIMGLLLLILGLYLFS